MTKRPTSIPLLVVAAVALSGTAALAQTQPASPGRSEANVWNDQEHQPTESQTLDREKQLGIAPSESQQNQINQQLQDISGGLHVGASSGGAGAGGR